MNKRRKKIAALFVAFVFGIFLTGCSLQDKMKDYLSNKEQCFLNTENITQLTYKNNTYTILQETVSYEELGEWIGYIRKLVAVDKSGEILYQENIETDTFQTMENLFNQTAEAAYMVSFLNVYAGSNTDNDLIVDINGQYHKAIINDRVRESEAVFDVRTIAGLLNCKFQINPQNATQLLCDNIIYQVTSDMVSDSELGRYIDILAQNITFDAKTKALLSKEELGKIDWYGKNAEQTREQWFYQDVCEINGMDKTEAVAVNVNDQYYIAKRQQ